MRHRRRQTGRRSKLIAAAVAALILAALAYTAVTAGNGLPLKNYYVINAEFHNGAEIDPYSDVRIAGVLVGQVRKISFAHGDAVLQLQLQPSTQRLRSDTTARIRLRGLIGAKYVELVPGKHGQILPSGATLQVKQTSTAVGVFDVLSTFNGKTRTDLRHTLAGLGTGFAGQGDNLNRALQGSPQLTADLEASSNAVNDQTGAAARLFPSADSFTSALYPVRADIADGFDPQARSLEPYVAARYSIQTALTELPSSLSQIQTGLLHTDPLLQQTAGLARETTALTRPAPSALRRAAHLLLTAAGPLRQTRTMLTALTNATPPALRSLRALAPLAAPSRRSLANSVPQLNYLVAYRCDGERWIKDWTKLFGFGTGPNTAVGLSGLARTAVANTSRGSEQNTPGAVTSAWYPAPCAPLKVAP